MVQVKLHVPGKKDVTLNVSEYLETYLKIKIDDSGIFKNTIPFYKFIELLSLSTNHRDDKKFLDTIDTINEWYKIEMED